MAHRWKFDTTAGNQTTNQRDVRQEPTLGHLFYSYEFFRLRRIEDEKKEALPVLTISLSLFQLPLLVTAASDREAVCVCVRHFVCVPSSIFLAQLGMSMSKVPVQNVGSCLTSRWLPGGFRWWCHSFSSVLLLLAMDSVNYVQETNCYLANTN